MEARKISAILVSLFLWLCLSLQAVNANDGQQSIILYNGNIYTMERHQPKARAIFIEGEKIRAVGNLATVLMMCKRDTRFINLKGKTVFPGFIDPHTHLFNEYKPYFQYSSFDNAQQLALENGITSFANMYTDQQWLDFILQYASFIPMRNRLFLYLNYNSSCGDVMGTWYENYSPKTNIVRNVQVNGVKIYAEQSVCGNVGTRPVFSEKLKANLGSESVYRDSQLHFSTQELASVVKRADDLGYQVAIHAMGDLGIETSLSAITSALNMKFNINRHMVLHNSFLRNDMFEMYSSSGILALVEPDSRCELNSYLGGQKQIGDLNIQYYKRWRDLIDSGVHVALDSDWPFYGPKSLNPMRKVYTMVTGINEFDNYSSPCEEPITEGRLTVLECIKMMTVDAAYALRMEKRIGSITPGKFADIVVLSNDPLKVKPIEIVDIKILMTMVGGKVEYEYSE